MAVVGPGDPWANRTWSGTSRRLLSALHDQGGVIHARSGRLRWLDLVELAASFSPARALWRQRYRTRTSWASPLARRATTRLVGRRLRSLALRPDVLLQIGGWYDGPRSAPWSGVITCSYHDENLATALASPGVDVRRSDASVDRAWAAERRLYDGLDLIFCMSDWARRSFVDQFQQDPSKVIVVGAGPNLDVLPEPPASRPPSNRFLFVGKGDFARKGGWDLLEAFDIVQRERGGSELWLVGQDKLSIDKPGVKSVGIVSRADPGGEARLRGLFNGALAFVMPSRHEPFGIAFLEAMAHGVPCIGTDRCAMPEIISHERSGFVVPARDPAALARRMIQLLDDRQLATRMGQEGYRRLHERYTWPRVATSMLGAMHDRIWR